ncbi:MAG: hypothetical protein ACKO01_11265 [Erythrobacter sp.]
MHSLFALTPFGLMLPLLAGALSAPAPGEGAASSDAGVMGIAEGAGLPSPFAALRDSSTAQQVRIEQRVVVRITPAPPAARQNLLADMPMRQRAPRFEEKGKEKCVPLQDIAAVQTGSGNRLVLLLRDRKMLSANLEKSCLARDFYSGFYVEKSKDGRLCVSRDRLRSRTGASCEVETMRRLVLASD